MLYQHIRQATAIITYGGVNFLIDPMLSKKGALPAFEPAQNGSTERNPIVELPISVENILQSVDAVILTHLHIDHWDTAAVTAINKEVPIFVQNTADQSTVISQGFNHVRVFTEKTTFKDVTLTKTIGFHGRTPEIIAGAGEVSGVIFRHADEKSLYLAGDTVWCHDVQQILLEQEPDIIVVNAGGNAFVGSGALVMTPEDIQAVTTNSPASQVIAVHLEATNHNTISRKELADFATEHDFNQQLSIPIDGETLIF